MKKQDLIENSTSIDTLSRAKVARHKDCPPELLVKFIEDPEYLVVFSAVTNPNFPLAEMEELVRKHIANKDNWGNVISPISYFSSNPYLPTNIIALWLDTIIEMQSGLKSQQSRNKIKSNVSANQIIFPRGSATQDILSLPNCPVKYLDYFIEQKDFWTYRFIAKNPSITIEQIEKIYRPKDVNLNYALLENSNKVIFDYVVEKAILQNEDRYLRCALRNTSNPVMKERLIKILIEKKGSVFNRTLIAKKSHDPELLKTLAGDANPTVRKAAVKNRATPKEAKVIAGLLGLKKLKYSKKK
jgi:hypothetical protein